MAPPLAALFDWPRRFMSILKQDVGKAELQQQIGRFSELEVATSFAGIGTAEMAIDSLKAAAKKELNTQLNLKGGLAIDYDKHCQQALQEEAGVESVGSNILELLPAKWKKWVEEGHREEVIITAQHVRQALKKHQALVNKRAGAGKKVARGRGQQAASAKKSAATVRDLFYKKDRRLKADLGRAKQEWVAEKGTEELLEAVQKGLQTRAVCTFTRRHTFEEMKPKILHDRSLVLQKELRDVHTGSPVAARPGDIHVAGSPCTDWSSMGQQQKLSGPTAAAFLVWTRWMLDNEPTIIIHENVKRFPVRILVELFGASYSVHSIELTPKEVGWPIARPRRYSLLLKKGRATLQRPLVELKEAFHQEVKLKGINFFVQRLQHQELPGWQQHFLAGYRASGATADGSIVDLSQNPWRGRGRQSAADGSCPAITRSSGTLWSEDRQRAMTGLERLAAHGIPVFSWAASAALTHPRSFANFKGKEGALTYFAGNAMHASCIGGVLAWMVGYVRVEPASAARGLRRTAPDAPLGRLKRPRTQ